MPAGRDCRFVVVDTCDAAHALILPFSFRFLHESMAISKRQNEASRRKKGEFIEIMRKIKRGSNHIDIYIFRVHVIVLQAAGSLLSSIF